MRLQAVTLQGFLHLQVVPYPVFEYLGTKIPQIFR